MNDVITGVFHGLRIHEVGLARIEHNALARTMIACIILPIKAAQVHHNIFLDNKASKVRVPRMPRPCEALDPYGFQDNVFQGNAFYLCVPDVQRKPFVFYRDTNNYVDASTSRHDPAYCENRATINTEDGESISTFI